MTNKTEYTQDEIASKLKQSIKKLLKEDKFLLENLANERSVSYKLAEYLQKSFGKKFNVDCEYNLNKLETKTLDGINECNKQRRTNRIYPDIIRQYTSKEYPWMCDFYVPSKNYILNIKDIIPMVNINLIKKILGIK